MASAKSENPTNPTQFTSSEQSIGSEIYGGVRRRVHTPAIGVVIPPLTRCAADVLLPEQRVQLSFRMESSMNLARVGLISAVLLACFAITPQAARSQDPFSAPAVNRSSPGIMPMTRWDALDTRYRFSASVGDGVGYTQGYNQIGVFQPIWIIPGELMAFIEPRGTLTYKANTAASVGAGLRYWNPEQDRILGGSFWWDVDDGTGRTYHQFGFNAESLGKYIDYRINGYWPTNTDRNVNSTVYTGNNFFIGPNIALGRRRNLETALRGGDFEVGGGLPYIGDIGLRLYAGGYYYDNTLDAALYGVRGRAEMTITQDLLGQFAVTNDKVFGTNLYGGFTWTLPNGGPAKWFKRTPTQYRLYEPIGRQYRVAVEQRDVTDFVNATNPRTGRDYHVVHVNNLRSGGNGNYETPYGFLPGAVAPDVDIIYVRRGTGTSANLNGGITLADNQQLLGEGVPHLINTVQAGNILLPDNNLGSLPTITSLTGAAVTLANNNTVSGFNIANPALHGITGTGITNFRLDNLNITNPGIGSPFTGGGIVLTNASGLGNINTSVVSGSELGGLILSNTGVAPLNLTVDNFQSTTGVNGIQYRMNGSALLATHNNVRLFGSTTGLELNASNLANIGVTSSNSQYSNNTQFGTAVASDNSTVNLNTTNDRFNGNAVRGVSIAALNGSTGGFTTNGGEIRNNGQAGLGITTSNASTLTVALANGTQIINNGTGGGGNGIDANLLNGSSLALNLSDVNVSNNNGHGVYVNANNSVSTNTIVRSVFNNNLLGGLRYDGNAGSTVQVFMNDNVVNNNNGPGLQLVGSSSTFVASLDNNLFSGNNGSGVWSFMNNSVLTLGAIRNQFVNNNGFGIGIASNGSTINSVIGSPTRNTGSNLFNNNQGSGYFTRLFGASVGNIRILNNNITRTRAGANEFTGQGVFIAAANTSQLNSSTIDGNWIGVESPNQPFPAPTGAGNAGDGIFVSATDASVVNNLTIGNVDTPNLSGNIVVNNGGNGISLDRRIAALFNGTIIQDNVVAQNAGNGVQVFAQHTFNAENTYAVNQNLIFGNTQNGVRVRTEGAAATVVDLDENIIRNNTQSGIAVEGRRNSAFDTQYVRGTWTGNEIRNNTQWGINIRGFATNDTSTLLNVAGQTGHVTRGALNIGTLGGGNGNLISENGFGGIQQLTPGFTEVTNNQISSNGATNPVAFAGSGIRVDINNITGISATGLFGNTFDSAGIAGLNFNTTNNTIVGNAGDGVTYLNTGLAGTGTISQLATINLGNLVNGNTGRGFNVINRGGGDTYFRLGGDAGGQGNDVSGNLREGVYILNTASQTQSATAASDVALAADGDVLSTPDMIVDVRGNQITGNGTNSNFEGTGLVLRVGAVGGVPFTTGSVALNAGAVGTTAGLAGNGRVNARVNSNSLTGNLGSDVLIESVVTTVDPVTTTGVWSATDFGIATPVVGVTDPLARLNLEMRNNIGGVADVTRAGATFTNAEGDFKSRLNTATPGGPFINASRPRNAQRLGSNVGIYAIPGGPGAAANWFYAGVGGSTFRVTSDSVGPALSPVPTFGGGTNFQNIVINDPQVFNDDFGWDQILPGSVTFP